MTKSAETGPPHRRTNYPVIPALRQAQDGPSCGRAGSSSPMIQRRPPGALTLHVAAGDAPRAAADLLARTHCTPRDSSRCWRHLEPGSHRLRQIPTPPGPDPLLWRAALLLLVAAVIGGSTAGTLHWLGGDPDLVH